MADLSNIHSYATEKTNDTTGEPSPILEIEPDDGLFLRIVNAARRGTAPGVPIYMDLRDSNDDPLPIGTEVRFQFETPSMNDRQTVSQVVDNIQTWKNLTIQEQQDEEYVDATKIELEGAALNVRDIDSFYFSIASDTQIDWTNSAWYMEGSTVDELPMK